MTVISAEQNTESLTLTLVAEFAAPVERVWQIWEDPRQLERWWGPPTWPATFDRHEFTPGGSSRYHMTGPNGEVSAGWWTVLAIDAPRSLEFDDGFTGDDGEPNPELPSYHGVVILEPTATGTRMTVTCSFASPEQMQQLMEMGMDEGMSTAMGQIDEVLGDAAA